MSVSIDARAPAARRAPPHALQYPAQRVAQRIASESQAIETAHALAAEFAGSAAERDRERRLPFEEIERFSRSGLWAITVPRAHGGIGASWTTVAEVFRIISAADPSIGQIPQNHFGNLNVIASAASPQQQAFFFGEVLKGARFGNAGPERNSKNVLDVRTRAEPDHAAGDGSYLLNGTRFYSTGALYAHWIPTRAIDEQGQPLFIYNRFDVPGLRVIDDWSSFGQRTTASGSVVFDQVRVPGEHILRVQDFLKRPNNIGPVSQLIQAAIDAGIAHAAVRDTIAFVNAHSRPYVDSGVERAGDDPYIIGDIGRLQVRLHAADALLERAAAVLDALPAELSFDQMAQASVAVAEAKVLSTEVSLLASEKLFELSGSAATLARHNLDRHWRNARVHTLHDPVRWKYHAIGNHALNGTPPPRHSWS